MKRSKSIRSPEGTVPLLIAAEKHGLTKKRAKEVLLSVPGSFVKIGLKYYVGEFGDNLLSLAARHKEDEQPINEEEEEPINEQAMDEVPDSDTVPITMTATDRLFDGEEIAIVKRCRLPNRQMMIVEYRGKEMICRCKDSFMFIPGMRIVIRMDGANLMSKYQPKKLGRY